mmetsp:Transcript_26757/g.58338  ORF Transcript_26757/g.58338 Transcript_26757/m.58338 type:complete len:229 (-) Transcript_26757:329-1015(-)
MLVALRLELVTSTAGVPLVLLQLALVLVRLLVVLVTAHVVVAAMDPLGHGPLLSLDDGAGAVHGPLLQLTIGLHAVEQDGISLLRLDCQGVLGTIRELGVDAMGGGHLGEHRLPALVRSCQVHEHSGVAVATVLGVLLVKEVVPVRVVLLLLLVPQHLQALTVVDRGQGPLGQAALNGLNHSILSTCEEHAITGPDVAKHGAARSCIHHTRALQALLSLHTKEVTLLL